MHKRTYGFSVLVISALGLAGCSGDAAQGGAVVDTIGGVPSVMNPEQGVLGDTVPWILSQYLVVAADQLYERKQALLAVDVGILPNGQVLVLDAGNQRVLRFDTLGAYVGSFGGQGSGPGDFAAPVFLEVADSEVFVLDVGLNRVTAFDTSGIFLRRFTVDMGGLVGTSGVFEAGGPDEIYVLGEPVPFVAAARDTGSAVLLRLTRSGEIADSVFTYSANVWTPIRRVDGGVSYVKTRFAPEPRLAAKPGALAVATLARYLIEVRQPDGALVRRVARQYQTVAVTDELRDSVLDLMVRGGKLPRDALEAVQFARFIPAIERLVLDDQGRLWVNPYAPDEPTRRDVFDEEGRFLGPIYLPLEIRLEDVRGDRVCGVVAQPSGASAVMCLRIIERERQ